MTNYGMEQMARERINDRLREAERGRLARAVPGRPKRGRSWPAKLTLSVARGLTRVAEAL